MLFNIVWGIDLIVALVVVFFFVVGVQDGSVSQGFCYRRRVTAFLSRRDIAT